MPCPLCKLACTLTWDNGIDLAKHAFVGIALTAKNYLAGLCSSWHHGTDEDSNGLLRQDPPTGGNLGAYPAVASQAIQDNSSNDLERVQASVRHRKFSMFPSTVVRFVVASTLASSAPPSSLVGQCDSGWEGPILAGQPRWSTDGWLSRCCR